MTAPVIGTVVQPAPGWLEQLEPEPVLDPGLEIVDPHHHLWQRRGWPYLLPELLADTGSGHRVTATVFVECVAFYKPGVAPHLRPLGETEFATGVAAMAASGVYGPTQACAGISGRVDLTRGAAVRDDLEAHRRIAGTRFKGIRHAAAWDASGRIANAHTQPPPGLYADATFREGFAQLAPLGLLFEAWQYHPQLPELLALARAFPQTTIVLNHCGGPLGVGPYEGRVAQTFEQWRGDLRALAGCANVHVKLGGLGMPIGVFDWHRRARPPTSQQMADDLRPWIETCIDAFGPARCMFESNFPVDGVSSRYATLWNAFKRLAAGASAAERSALFSGTARRVYTLPEETP